MKAKSWKKLVKKRLEEEQEQLEVNPIEGYLENLSETADTEGVSSLEAIAAQNSSLQSLLEERDQLEQQMALATGGGQSSDWVNDPRFRGGEIASISQKQERDRLWAEARQRAADRVQAQRDKQSEWEVKRKQQTQRPGLESDQRYLNKLAAEQNRFQNIETGSEVKTKDEGFSVGASNTTGKVRKEMDLEDGVEMTTNAAPIKKKEEASIRSFSKPEKEPKSLSNTFESFGSSALDRVGSKKKSEEADWEANRDKRKEEAPKLTLDSLASSALDRVGSKKKPGEADWEANRDKRKEEAPKLTLNSLASSALDRVGSKNKKSGEADWEANRDKRKEEAPKAPKHTLESLATSALDRVVVGKKGKSGDAEWEAKREKRQESLRKAKKTGGDVLKFGKKAYDGIDKLYGTVDDLDKRLKSANAKAKEAAKAEGMDDFGFSDDSSSDSMGGDMMGKIKNNPLMKSWEKVREKKQETLNTKKKYETMINKALSTDLGSLVNLDEKAEKLRQKAQEKRKSEKEAERKEEKKRQQKADEKREQKRQQKRERN